MLELYYRKTADKQYNSNVHAECIRYKTELRSIYTKTGVEILCTSNANPKAALTPERATHCMWYKLMQNIVQQIS